jgi:ubiquinone/menaquinone biosynthesis C-methylase UbiE
VTVTPAEFWDGIAADYSERPIADIDSYERKLAATQALMRPDMRVLELGCGTGSTALAHAPHVARVEATDISSAMIAIGRDKAQRAAITNVGFRRAGVEDVDAPDGTFDMVLALNLLHLLPDRAAAMSKIHRLLKPSGLFVSSTVCLADRMWYLRPVIPIMQWIGKAPYVSFIRSATVLREIEDSGFVPHEHWSHGRANSLFVIARKREA